MDAADDDDTPPARPAFTISAEAEALGDIQLAFVQLAEDSGRAADRIDKVADVDRADVLALYRRRVLAVTDRLRELVDGLAKA